MEEKKKKEEKKKASLHAGATASVYVADSTSERTRMYNKECNNIRAELSQKRQACQAELDRKLTKDATHVGDRSKGVNLAWGYEVAEVKMGGKGTVKWNSAQRKELLTTGKVRGAEGHHINSVAENPPMQVNPDNVEFCRGRKAHLDKHNGKFQNPTKGPLLDRDKRLVDTNKKRVLKNEATGFVVAVGIGAMTEAVSSVVNECKENGASMKSVKNGFKKCGKPVLRSCLICGVSYTITRGLNYLLFKA